MTYQGHAADGGIQNHSVGESLRNGYIIGHNGVGWFAQCVKTGRRTVPCTHQSAAEHFGKQGRFTLPAKAGTYTGGGRACRPAAS